MSFCTKSSDQGTFQRGNQTIYLRVRLSKTYILWFLARISSDQGHFLSPQGIKTSFHKSKTLILVTNGSTGLMKVTTLVILLLKNSVEISNCKWM